MDVLKSFSLEGKVALLTGGAGLYGRQIVAALAEAGADTYIASRNLEALEVVSKEECDRGNKVTAMQFDLSSDDSMKALVDEIISRSGKIDILINNAVTRSACTDGWSKDSQLYTDSLHVNASALFTLTRLVADDMVKRKEGSVINIGSMMGMVGVEMANYAGTEWDTEQSPIYFYEKGGMINFTRWAASILGKDNIRVNCVSPGGLWQETHPKQFVKQYSERTQLGRMANQEDLKGTIVFLASDASVYITGANIPLDGGYTAK
ncbi:MAG: SDR family NAD(P)-dependent oxidoreductase [Planctomycetota bacterium]|jgi:NAD(P)-dependent dehydrogenase (short-subunit alcohol dehydrogenase family)